MASGTNTQRHRPSMTRVVGYELETDDDVEGIEEETELYLAKEVEKPGTPVTQYGISGAFMWINGKTGAEFRRVRAELRAMGWRNARNG